MKTPMQEHIEWLKKEKDLHGYERGLHYEMAIEHAESMLEKEKEVMCEFTEYWSNSMQTIEEAYNKTFNTKER